MIYKILFYPKSPNLAVLLGATDEAEVGQQADDRGYKPGP